jgi:hypothetical protein
VATKFQLPPSARDFELTRAVRFEGLSTWEAASRFGISQMRVRQILGRVADWVIQALPPLMESDAEACLRYAEYLASDRLEHHYQESMAQWRATHQTRFLMQAMRVTLAAGKLPAPSGMIEAAMADAVEEEGGQETEEDSGQETVPPPVRDFSARGDLQQGSAAAMSDENVASAVATGLLELLRSGPPGAAAALSDGTRSLLTTGGDAAITQVRLTREQPGASVERLAAPAELPLSRQERRRLRKKLKKAKGLSE